MSRMFGTDGVRGVANTELTADIAYSLGRAGAYVLTEGTHKPKILVAKDTRISGDMLEAALVAGILSVGAEAVLLGVVPTRQYFIVKEGLKQIDDNIFFLSCDAYEVSSRKKQS